MTQASKPQTTKDTRVYHSLREDILERRLKPGERIIERDICQALGVTRTPVRQALRRLEQEGLLTMKPYRGCQVRQIALDEVAPLFDIREALEGVAARAAATSTDEAIVQELYAAAARVDDAAANADWSSYFDLDQQFHSLLIRASGNPRVAEIMEVYSFQLCTFAVYDRYLLNVVSALHKSEKPDVHRHENLVDAIARRDPEAAERVVREHIRLAKSLILGL